MINYGGILLLNLREHDIIEFKRDRSLTVAVLVRKITPLVGTHLKWLICSEGVAHVLTGAFGDGDNLHSVFGYGTMFTVLRDP